MRLLKTKGTRMKIGRNEPCPCGSGKKYKKCCLNKKKPPENLLWHRLSDTYDKLQDQLLDYARKTFGDLAFPLAMDEFLVWPEEENPIDLIANHMPLFMPWFLFEWVYDPEDAEIELPAPAHQPVAMAYLDAHGSRLDRLEQKLIEATLDQPFSFYEVMSCRPGEGFRLKDILRGIETEVSERQGSEQVRPGDILLGRVVQIDQVTMLIGCSSILIQPKWKPEIIDLRKAILQEYSHITAQVLIEYDIEIRELYLYIYESSMTPPQICNTDGEPMVFHKLHYEIDDPEVAFQNLVSLSTVEDETTLRSMATLDDGGMVKKAEIPWSRPGHKKSKALDNTILGRIMIDPHKLLIEVNSEARAEVARKE
ncbi:MAG: SEC-C domain-containing protein, partial [Deltaproteobacteria bacterium]|nr:SEC-C domain-containing protein [Deltaproteobacteria bacterium]